MTMVLAQNHGPAITLEVLLEGIADQSTLNKLGPNRKIQGLTLDSRVPQCNKLFFALPGVTADGRDFVKSVVDQGAALVLFEDVGAPEQCSTLARERKAIGIPNLRSKLSLIAGRFFNKPSARMKIAGITGTNGKTTCAYVLAQALDRLGEHCAIMGTLGIGFPDQLNASDLTTSDAVETQRILRQLCDSGATAVCMEVSSHGLQQDRVAAVDFNIAIFTNLTQDHLDYHGTIAEYANAKKTLFDFDCLDAIIVNQDDPVGREILEINRHCQVISYGQTDADIFPSGLNSNLEGINFTVNWMGQSAAIKSSLMGQVNIPNVLAIVATLLVLGYSLEQIAAVMPGLRPPPGRMELFNARPTRAQVIVDYSHTPDSLGRALTSLRTHCQGDLWVVFGCGGDRDRGKRPLMGAVAEALADHIIITNDNPRNEDPNRIIENILEGIKNSNGATDFEIVLDRRQAITRALEAATAGDLVLVAGKGHEQTQTIGSKILSFSDREVVQQLQGIQQ